jgi:hypothetical protein
VTLYEFADVFQEHIASTFRVKVVALQEADSKLSSDFFFVLVLLAYLAYSSSLKLEAVHCSSQFEGVCLIYQRIFRIFCVLHKVDARA